MKQIPSKAEILQWISDHPTKAAKRDIAKAFGIKRTVHRISLAYADLVGRRTTITWVQD